MDNQSNLNLSTEYTELLVDLKSRIRSASVRALYKVNSEMIQLYFDLGKQLSEKMIQNAELNSKFNIVKQASYDLITEFGEGKGYSERNLKYMVKLYHTYMNQLEVQRVVALVPWGSNCEILDANLGIEEQEFYLKYSVNTGCTRPVLRLQIQTNLYSRDKQIAPNNFDLTIPQISEQAKELVKDKYVLQVVDPQNILHERHLENKLKNNIKEFLLELGTTYTYMGNQYRLLIGDNENYIDLMFFNRELQCLFAIDLKMEEFKPDYVGKLQYYLELVDSKVKLPHENPSIGIILCTEKDNLKVEATLKRSNSPIAVSTYDLVAKLEQKIPELINKEKNNDRDK